MFGMETSYFRFSKEYEEPRVFNASQNFVFYFSFVFSGFIFLYAGAISNFLGYQNHENYIQIFAAILFFDNITNIPFAQLRFEEIFPLTKDSGEWFSRLYNSKQDRTFKELEEIARRLRKLTRGFQRSKE